VNASRAILWLLVWLPVSCAPDSGAGKTADSSTPPAHQTLSQRMEQKNGYQQDANGNWTAQSGQRSSFETKGKSAYFEGKYQTKTYQAPDYATKSWWGNKSYDPQKYAGNTDASRLKTDSGLSGKGAREAGTAADIHAPYQTGTYATGAARETGHDAVSKPSDTQTDIRRRVFKQPDIIDWREQRSLSLEQSRGILGH
jgi:hypothetical protein